MAWKNNNKEFTVDIKPGFDFIIEEGGNTSINLRMISWNGRDHKLDLRKWTYKEDGQEQAMKGVSLTEEGGNELASVLVEQGYGDTKRIVNAIKKRQEYDNSLDSINTDEIEEDDGSEEYYDPSELFGGD